MHETTLPKVIGLKTAELAPLLIKWEKANKGVPWSELIRRGLKHELAKFAGKRHRDLVASVLFFCLTQVGL
jgi:hypothetical protein